MAHRFNCELPNKEYNAIKKFGEKMELTSVIRSMIVLIKVGLYCFNKIEEGCTVVVRYPDGKEREIEWIV